MRLGFVLVILIGLCSCQTAPTDLSAFEVIRNPQSSLSDVHDAIEQLPRVTEDPTFWSRIANDTGFSRDHRRACILELFRRHVKRRAELKDVANVLNNPSWLAKEQIHFFGPLAGFVPVTLTFDDSVFSIVILPEPNGDASAVYLRIKGKLTEDELFE